MTPTLDAPDTTAGDTDLFQDISAALNEGNETTDQPVDEGLEATGEQTPGGEAPTAPPVVPGEAPQPPGEGPNYQLTEDGKSYIVPKEEVTAFTGVKQYADEVQQMFPTANDAKYAQVEQALFRAVWSDYTLGKEQEHDAVLNFLAKGGVGATPEQVARCQQSFPRLAMRMPEVLKQVNPEAHEQLTGKILDARVNDAYEQARLKGNIDDPNDPLLLAAQRLEWALTGKYRTNDIKLRTQWGVDGLKRVDPNQVAQDQIAQRQTAVDKRESDLLQRDFENFNKEQMDGPKWKAYGEELDKALAPHQKNYPPKIFASIRKSIDADVRAKLTGDLDWRRVHNNERRDLEEAYGQLWKQRQPADSLKQRIEGYKNDLLSRARRYIPSIAKEYLDQATANQVAQNAQTRAQNGRFTKPAAAPAPANGQPTQRTGRYDIHSDPEFTSMFK